MFVVDGFPDVEAVFLKRDRNVFFGLAEGLFITVEICSAASCICWGDALLIALIITCGIFVTPLLPIIAPLGGAVRVFIKF